MHRSLYRSRRDIAEHRPNSSAPVAPARYAAALVAVVAVLQAIALPATAAVCSKSSTVAAGAPGYFRFLAAGHAKNAWARKVARDPKLGSSYSRWPMAQSAKVTCRQIADRYRCVAVGNPCSKGEASTTPRQPKPTAS